MFSRFRRTAPIVKRLFQDQSNSITTFSSPELKAHVEGLEKSNPFLHKDMNQLRDSPQISHFEQRPKGGRSKHELHRAAQHDSNLQLFHVDTVTSVQSNETHRPAMELSALASGQGLTPTQESRKRLMEAWKRDPGQPGYNATIPDALDLLKTSKFHSHSRNRLGKLGFDLDDIQ